MSVVPLISEAWGVYEGETSDTGKAHGQGKMTFHNGNVYRGSFENDMFHGQGEFTFADGRHIPDTYRSVWRKGEEDLRKRKWMPSVSTIVSMRQRGYLESFLCLLFYNLKTEQNNRWK